MPDPPCPAQKIWDNTSDGEKPAAIAILIGVVVAQISIGATVDAVDKLPFINKLLQLVGVAVSGVFAYRYFTDPAERCGGGGSVFWGGLVTHVWIFWGGGHRPCGLAAARAAAGGAVFAAASMWGDIMVHLPA